VLSLRFFNIIIFISTTRYCINVQEQFIKKFPALQKKPKLETVLCDEEILASDKQGIYLVIEF